MDYKMTVFYYVMLVVLHTSWASNGFPQYVYNPYSSASLPFIQQQGFPFIQQPFIQQPAFSFRQPYNSPLLPVNPFIFQQQQQPLPIPQSVFGFRSQENHIPPQSSINDYRGFGYKTDYTDGATSTVVFVTGPDSLGLSSRNTGKAKARTLASDSLDANALNDDTKGNAESVTNRIRTLTFPQNFMQSFPDLKNLFEKPASGILHLYRHPANTVLLTTQSTNDIDSDNSDSVEINSILTKNTVEDRQGDIQDSSSARTYSENTTESSTSSISETSTEQELNSQSTTGPTTTASSTTADTNENQNETTSESNTTEENATKSE